ncbi:ABC transporter ATP-binding protein [Solitalea canadensis]|uniref:ABC-type multidrug transport system, ATPase and permease component n=1 Tax=Solitalea canadensis (strain ATCC 29591 / DSM 3403 / JCM 21819 / LMG 8368 / NBRC 15130 / NCIMB 12057 / USAM 9D) TaxID=929556 RepID=H8KRB9_SOLCM|nr:ABC transporter ATP-binding protein [Solitalea canadensis]AFD07386.1 ABC-type multidrug transport system, ATPase and permease component [Solitalea canadensis DSM 3403]
MGELKYLNKYLFRYRYRLALGAVFVIISNYFGVIPAKIIRRAFDLVNENITLYKLFSGFSNQDSIYQIFGKTMLIFGASVLLMAILRGIFLFFMRQTIIVVSRYIEYDLKNDIYNHYQHLSLSFYRRNNTGDLMNRISEDVSRVRMYVGPAIMYTINTVVLFLMVITTMASINLKLTIFALLPLPLMAIVIYYVNSIIHRKSENIQEQLSNLSTFTQETFSGIRVLKAYGREQRSREDFEAQSEEYKKRSMGLARVQAFFYPTVLLLAGMSVVLTVYIGGVEVKNGNITPGNIAEFIVYINQLTFPMMSLGWVTSLIQRGAASQKRINEFMHTEPDIKSGTLKEEPIRGKVEFRNVSFTYPDTGIQALKNVSFVAESGDFIAFIGRTGSGKSTIANLLARMYDVNAGEILIDDRNIKDYDLHHLRDAMGYVPQEVFLFSDTISNNIGFGVNKVIEEQVFAAAKNAAVYENIQAFPHGFETTIGERGITLSGGQKQRVSIARAIIKEPNIMVFDDCLSAVDTKTEEEILSNLGKVMENKTSVIISHRVSSIKNADKIFVIDNGVIIESGYHEALLEQKGEYFELYEKQLLEEEEISE